MKSPTVFVSHTSHDQTIAGMVCQALEQRHIRCWIAPRDIDVGDIWDDAIVNGIKSCQIVVLIFSSGTNDSPHVKREIHLAFDKSKLVIPFRVEDVKPEGGLEYMMMGVQWLDAVVPPIERHVRVLADRVEAIVAAAEAKATVAELAPRAKQVSAVGQTLQMKPEPAPSRTEQDAELDSLREQLRREQEKLKRLDEERQTSLEAERKRQEEASLVRAAKAGLHAWDEIEKAHSDKASVKARVIDCIEGGLTVDILGARAFLPGYLVDIRPIRNLDALKGQDLEVRIIEVNKKLGNIVVSRKQILDEEITAKRDVTSGKS